MKKHFFRLIVVLFCCALADFLSAAEVNFAIEGQVIKVEPARSVIIVGINRYKSVELSLADIQTLAVMDTKKLTDDVGRATIIGGLGGGLGAWAGIVPKNLRHSKLRDAGVTALVAAGFSALAMVFYNQFTKKPPMLVYDSGNKILNDIAVINNLPIGTKIMITEKNSINGQH